MESQLIKFPEHKIVRENTQIDVIEKAREKGKTFFADEIVNNILDTFAEHLDYSGLDLESDASTKDMIYAAEAIRSAVYRAVGLHHDLQDVADKTELPEDTDEGE